MSILRQHILIKGNKEGLQFHMDEQCSLEELYQELQEKIRYSHAQFLQGPLTHVKLYLGNRYLTPEQKKILIGIIEQAGNLIVKGVYSEVFSKEEVEKILEERSPKIEVGYIRSGQVVQSEQDIFVLGDVNPGGWVISSGNIYVMGALKGIAHAGYTGDRDKIVAASLFLPMQIRIADSILEEFPIPDEGAAMRFAYWDEGVIKLERIQFLKAIKTKSFDDARRNG